MASISSSNRITGLGDEAVQAERYEPRPVWGSHAWSSVCGGAASVATCSPIRRSSPRRSWGMLMIGSGSVKLSRETTAAE